jgi:hypothetical protein
MGPLQDGDLDDLMAVVESFLDAIHLVLKVDIYIFEIRDSSGCRVSRFFSVGEMNLDS